MPVTKSAIKKLNQDKKKTAVNKKIKQQLTVVVKDIKKNKKKSINEAYSKIDKASKKGIIHPNKAARLKSQLSKIATSTPSKNKVTKKASASKKKTTKK